MLIPPFSGAFAVLHVCFRQKVFNSSELDVGSHDANYSCTLSRASQFNRLAATIFMRFSKRCTSMEFYKLDTFDGKTGSSNPIHGRWGATLLDMAENSCT